MSVLHSFFYSFFEDEPAGEKILAEEKRIQKQKGIAKTRSSSCDKKAIAESPKPSQNYSGITKSKCIRRR